MSEQKVNSGSLEEISQAIWERTQSRFAALERLSRLSHLDMETANQEAAALGISVRHLFRLSAKFALGAGRVTDLLPSVSSGGRGKSRISGAAEAVVRDLIQRIYLKRPAISVTSLHRKIVDECLGHEIPPPSRATVARRVAALDPVLAGRKRKGFDSVRQLLPAAGETPPIAGPLGRVEIDHTPMDIIVVDAVERRPIGRPYLTLAIDNYSRCIVGAVITLEPPSSLSVALCLTRIVADKTLYLEGLGAKCDWPMKGKPSRLYMDNAVEFKSFALKRGAEQHSIELGYRPLGRPQNGGTIERSIGTFMRMVHELPGTTMENPAARGRYNSDKDATFTLRELELWMVLAISEYHGTLHRSIMKTPKAQWEEGLRKYGGVTEVSDQASFFIDFLPAVKRSISRRGFQLDYITYYSHALRPWIARRHRLAPFWIRRDPRDISRIWVEDPDSREKLEVPSRLLNQEPITLWEHKAAVRERRAAGLLTVDEIELARLRAEKSNSLSSSKAATRASRRTEARSNDAARSRSTPQPFVLEPPDVHAPRVRFSQLPDITELEDWT